MIDNPYRLEPAQKIVLTVVPLVVAIWAVFHFGTIASGIFFGIGSFLMGYVWGVIGKSLENSAKSEHMKRKLIEDVYYRMEARKRMDRNRR